jgi:hypothetical protein
MTNLIATLFFRLLISQSMTQLEFETKSDSLINSMLTEYRIVEPITKINRYSISNARWNRRIELKSKDLFNNKYGQKDYQEYTFTFLYFTDQDSLLKARQDYIDNFSSDGRLSPETTSIKRPPSFNLITENAIIIFEVSCEGLQMDQKWSWDHLKNELFSTFGNEQSEIIENGCGGPMTWKNNRN